MSEEKEMVEGFESPISLHYTFAAGRAPSRFLHELKKGKLVGQRSEVNGKVIFPPRGACCESGTPTREEVELEDTATVISFTVVHIPIPGNPIKPPYFIANLVLDGSDQTFIHLISEVGDTEIQQGSRVQAVWKDPSEWGYAMENIKYFKPLDEPPLDIEQLEAERLEIARKYIEEKNNA